MEYSKCSFGTECLDKVSEEMVMGSKQVQVGILPTSSVQEILRALGMDQYEPKDTEYGGKRLVCGHTWMDGGETEHVVSNTKTLQREEEANVITLAGLKIFPKIEEQGGETIVGTLEVHANGFYYATSTPNLCFSFFYADVETSFFRFGDKKTPPLLHFHFHEGIKVGIEKRRDIQFRLVQTPVGQKRSYDDSYKINEDLKNFVHNVEEKWRGIPVLDCFPFVDAEVHKAYEFQGSCPSKAPTIFGLTPFALVGLVDEPFIVVDLHEIRGVHLRLKPRLSKPLEIDMTIVFEDFKRDPVEINSIPIKKLNLIKNSFNLAGVQYCENDIDWCSMANSLVGRRSYPPVGYAMYPTGTVEYCGREGDSYCGPDGEAYIENYCSAERERDAYCGQEKSCVLVGEGPEGYCGSRYTWED
ncbi:hypothetical protein MKX03_026487 [Papaver bracteatum]|nr:hypothetical protein MKX03_026487 [Papaver bracteatum]